MASSPEPPETAPCRLASEPSAIRGSPCAGARGAGRSIYDRTQPYGDKKSSVKCQRPPPTGPAPILAPCEVGLTLFDEGRHALLLVFEGEQGVEQPPFQLHALA